MKLILDYNKKKLSYLRLSYMEHILVIIYIRLCYIKLILNYNKNLIFLYYLTCEKSQVLLHETDKKLLR